MPTMPLRFLILAAAAVVCVAGGCDFERAYSDKTPHAVSMEPGAVSPEGWRGTRYFNNGVILSEELDALGSDGRPDLWRYYEDGHLVRLLRDLDQDGRIDLFAQYDRRWGCLQRIERYESSSLEPNFRILYLDNRLWRQTWDRNRDGREDFRFEWRAPRECLTDMGIDPARLLDAREVVPQGLWFAFGEDTDFDGQYDSWTAYKDGRAVAAGVDRDSDGKMDRWTPLPVPETPRPLTEEEARAELGRRPHDEAAPPAAGE